MKIKVILGIGVAGCYREDIIEIPDEELEGLNEEERERFINEYLSEWAWRKIDCGWQEIE